MQGFFSELFYGLRLSVYIWSVWHSGTLYFQGAINFISCHNFHF